MRQILASMALFAVAACGTQTTYNVPTAGASAAGLDAARTVMISTPQNGSYGGRQYINSGQMTAEIVRSAFSRAGPRAQVTGGCDLEACLQQARSGGYGYMVQPDILRWEDRATEWSGISDKVEIKLTVYDVATRKPVSSQIIVGNSSIWTLGGDHPQDLLPQPVSDYVGGLYR